jgi:hypothetical protein
MNGANRRGVSVPGAVLPFDGTARLPYDASIISESGRP